MGCLPCTPNQVRNVLVVEIDNEIEPRGEIFGRFLLNEKLHVNNTLALRKPLGGVREHSLG